MKVIQILKIINLIKNTQFKPLLELRSNKTFLSEIFYNVKVIFFFQNIKKTIESINGTVLTIFSFPSWFTTVVTNSRLFITTDTGFIASVHTVSTKKAIRTYYKIRLNISITMRLYFQSINNQTFSI